MMQSPGEFVLPNGKRMAAPPQGQGDVKFLYSEIFEQRCYEQEGISLEGLRTVLDVGANIGMFALRVREASPNARITCFEPAPLTRACLERNVANWSSAEVLPYAVGDQPGKIEMAFYPQSPGNTTAHPEVKMSEARGLSEAMTLSWVWSFDKPAAVVLAILYPWRRHLLRWSMERVYKRATKFEAEVITLDSHFERTKLESVDLLKIDVEGFEPQVIAGLSDANLRKVKQLVIEIAPRDKPTLVPELSKRLQAAGIDQIALRSFVPTSDPLTDDLSCTLYARRSAT